MNRETRRKYLAISLLCFGILIIICSTINLSPLIPVPATPTATWTIHPTRTLTFTATATSTPSSTFTATATDTTQPTNTATHTLTHTLTVEPTETPEPTATETLELTATETVEPTATRWPTSTKTPEKTQETMPNSGGKMDPQKCENGYELQLGALGKDLVIYLNCKDDEIESRTS